MELPVLVRADAERVGACRKALLDRLARSLAGEVHVDAHHCALYSTDASIYQVEPIAVVVPRTLEDIRKTVSACSELGLGVLGRGAGTSLAGQTVGEAVVIDCSVHLHDVERIEAEGVGEARAVIQPGVVLDELCARVAHHGLRFGPDVSTSTHATVGGMIMNCSAGMYSLREGMTDEHVIALDVVLADGTPVRLEEGASERDERVRALTAAVVDVVLSLEEEIDSRFPRVRRNVGGYALDDILAQVRASTPGTYDRVNLARLICGSEGTLAFLERATVRLQPLPGARALALACFDSVDDAVQAVVPALASSPAAVELVDANIIDAAAAQSIYADDVALIQRADGSLPRAALYVEWFLEKEQDRQGRFDALEQALENCSILRVDDAATAARLWAIRKVGLGLISKAEGTCIPMPGVEDCAVAPERLVEFRRKLDGIFQRHGRSAVYYAHASVGLLHVRPRIDVASTSELEAFARMQEEVLELVRAYDGSISGEHGDGRIRSTVVQEFYGPELCAAFTRIKEIFDPTGIFNPADKVEIRPMTDSLRHSFTQEDEGIGGWTTFHEFDAEGSFGEAVRACDGNALCRRTVGGAMCPSYRVTREERHATRGRANALVALARGECAPDDPELLETLSLCVACKACRHECPSNVDMARLKSEVLAQNWARASRVPLREVLLGRAFHRLNRIGSRMRLVANLLAGWGPSRHVFARFLGLAPELSLPRFERMLQSQVPARRNEGDEGRPTVVLFPDCFTNCNEPDKGIAAIEVLEAFGYRVVVPSPGECGSTFCCGRAAISGGFLPTARGLIEQTAVSLLGVMDREDAVGVVVVEPSCASALTEDWLELRSDVPRADRERIAGCTDVLEGFLLARWDEHPRRPEFSSEAGSVRVHQHCHMNHTGTRLGDLLERCIGTPVQTLDSGCCGMAGSFGYRACNRGISRAMAKDSLGRFLEEPGGAVVAPGTSCRHQVAEVFGHEALHPAELLRGLLAREVSA